MLSAPALIEGGGGESLPGVFFCGGLFATLLTLLYRATRHTPRATYFTPLASPPHKPTAEKLLPKTEAR